MFLQDAVQLDGVRRTGNGYLTARAKIARTGVQVYAGHELNHPEMPTVRVYRPAEVVFSDATLHSAAYRPMTNDHPPELVTADNWKKYSIGQTGGAVSHDQKFTYVDMVMMDAAAIRDYDAGKRQLSMGYEGVIEFKDGVSPDGEAYDAVQTSILYNHLAQCDAARGGTILRIPDGQPKQETTMADTPALKTVTVDGISISVTDQGAQVIEKLQKHLADAATAKTASDAKIAELTTASATKDAEIVTLKKQVADAKITPAQLRDAAKSYATTVAVAKKIAPAFTVSDSMDEAAIMKAVVGAKLGDAAKDWTDAQIVASFATFAKDVKVEADPLRTAIASGLQTHDADGEATKAHDQYVKGLSDAWRQKPEAEKAA